MTQKEEKQSHPWQKWESFAKILAGFSAAISAIAIPILINTYTEENRKAEMLIKTMSEREKSDTDIRQSMFKSLVDGYFGSLKTDFTSQDEESFRRRIMFLELLTVNFQEFFNAKPLFQEVYIGLDRKQQEKNASAGRWKELQGELIRISKEIVSRQKTMLNSVTSPAILNLNKDAPVCVRLYDKADFDLLKRQNTNDPHIPHFEPGSCLKQEGAGGKSITGDNRRQSLEIRPVEFRKERVTVQVVIYEDLFKGNLYQGSEAKQTMTFDVSYFDLPYMDNIKLSDGNRFALVLRQIYEDETAEVEVIRFKNDFMSLRDRPLFEEMVEKLQKTERIR
ncbi:MAG: hypothetical protein WAO55_01355 [Candidatus Manganitrophaceae bacterium]